MTPAELRALASVWEPDQVVLGAIRARDVLGLLDRLDAAEREVERLKEKVRVTGVCFGALGEVETVDLDIGRADGKRLCEVVQRVEVVEHGGEPTKNSRNSKET